MDCRVKYYKKNNGGIADARNFGLKRAQGEYVCFCDQDDVVSNDMYTVLLKDISSGNVDLVISNPASNINGMVKNSNSIFESKIENDIAKLLLEIVSYGVFVDKNDNGIIWPTVWNCLFKRKIIENNNIEFHSFVNYEDDELFLANYLIHCNSVYLEKKNLYYWTEHNESRSHSFIYVNDLEVKIKQLWDYRRELLNNRIDKKQMSKVNIYMSFSVIVKLFLNEANDNHFFKNIKAVHRYKKKYCGKDVVKQIRDYNIVEKVGQEYRIIYKRLLMNSVIATIIYKGWKYKEIIKGKMKKEYGQK